MNLFGRQKDNMTQDNDKNHDKHNGGAGRGQKKEVDLFPAVVDRKPIPGMEMSNPRQFSSKGQGPQIYVYTPMSFDEALDIVESLRSRASTTLCLEKMRKVDASRLVDFVSGASAAIDGDFHKLNEHVYVFCPSNVRLVTSGMEKPGNKSVTAGPLDFLYPDRAGGGERTSFEGLWPK